MKRVLLLIFSLINYASGYSQDLTERFSEILNQIGKEIPSDQLYLHIDRNLYHAGDTIWFQAYVRDSRTGIFATESNTLYVLLLNDGHATVDSARFRIIYSSVSGWLKVPDDVQMGDYSILAFTSIGMNYSPEYAFSVPVRIDKIVTTPEETDRKLNNAETASQIPLQLPQLDFRFLPEGGTFISGIRQRLAFNAVRASGKGLEVSGRIINQRDQQITEFRSTRYGPGVVEFTPAPGDTYFAVIGGDEFREVKWSLPFAERSGVSMRVNNAGNGLMDIILRGREITGNSYFLTVTLNNVLVFSEDVKLDTLYRKRILTDKLPSGTAYVTLYDSELSPVAERLVFLNEYKKMNVSAELSSSPVFRGEETELTIHTTDITGEGISSVVSVAVIDSAAGYYNGIALPDIEATYLYDRDFYNNLPFSVRSNGMETIDPGSVDILLMTYGWRSFHPAEIAPDSSEKELSDYDLVKIINPGSVKRSRSDIKLITDVGVDLYTLPLNDKREAILPFDSIDPGARQIMILPDKTPLKNSSPVNVLFPENKMYTDDARWITALSNYFNPEFNGGADTPLIYDPGSIIVIEPVTIKAPRQAPKKYEDKYAKMYQYTGARTMTQKDFREAATFEDILYKYNPFYLHTNSWYTEIDGYQVYLRGSESVKSSQVILPKVTGPQSGGVSAPVSSGQSEMLAALIVVDGSPIGKSYQVISAMPASEIVSVTFLKGDQGFAMYGSRANGGVVFVTTKMSAKIDGTYVEETVTRNDDLLKQVRLFRTETEFYVPVKEEVAHIPQFQFRPTILWKADLVIDDSGSIKIKYPNNLIKSTTMVFVNGISFTNHIGSARLSYRVR